MLCGIATNTVAIPQVVWRDKRCRNVTNGVAMEYESPSCEGLRSWLGYVVHPPSRVG